jgi:hypothetical protein
MPVLSVRTVLDITATLYAVMLVLAAAHKAESWAAWKAASSQWSPTWIPRKMTAVGLPLIEGLVAALLLIRPAEGLLGTGVFLILLGLGVALLVPTHRGEKCHCFGVQSSSSIGASLVVRNLILGAVALLAYVLAIRVSHLAKPIPLLLAALLVVSTVNLVAAMLRVGDTQDRLRSQNGAL